MKKAISFLEKVKETEMLDFEPSYFVSLADALKAAEMAYNEALDDAKIQLTLTMEHHPITDIRDLSSLNKLKQ